MKTINMPGFGAEASLYNGKYRGTRKYQQEAPGKQRGDLERTAVIPQLGGPGSGSPAQCLDDCADKHRTWTTKQCKAYCRDHPGTPLGYGPYCSPNPPGGCDIEFYACCVATGPLGCVAICAPGRDNCFQASIDECDRARRGT